MKTCRKCGETKSVDQFSKQKSNRDGRSFCCKVCAAKYARNRYVNLPANVKSIANKQSDERKKLVAIKFPWRQSLMHAKRRCNYPKSKSYKWYGARGIKCLLSVDQIKFLWERDRAGGMSWPSLDRINNDGHYAINNCRFIEMSENARRGSRRAGAV